jgi:hypothetical protein
MAAQNLLHRRGQVIEPQGAKDPAKPRERQLVGFKKCLLRGVRIGPMKGRAGGHRTHAEDVDFALLAVDLGKDLIPVHLCFVAKLVRLRDENLVSQQPHRGLALAHILAHRGLTDNDLRLLLLQPRPDAMRRVPLLARGSTIRFQNRVDERQRRGQLRSLPLWLLPLWRHCAGQSLPHFPPMNTQSPRYRADRPGTMLVLSPDLLV